MAANEFSVKVTGLSDLRTALRAMSGNLDKQMEVNLLGIANVIAQADRNAMPVLTGYARSTIKPSATRGGARVSEGTGGPSDYVGWLDFGGHVGRYASISRPVLKKGRYLYQQGLALRPQTIKALDAAIDQAAKAAGLQTEGHLDA